MMLYFLQGYLILKNYKPQVVLAAAGIFLMMCGVWLGFGGVLDPAKSSGYLIVDIYNEILRMLSNRIAGLGLSIMAVGGYARYMERIGASRAMVSLLSRPLKLIRSPYIILSATYVIGQIMAQFITSASGLGMLLMVTLFPTLVSLGVSRLSAVAVIATTMSIEWGILETNSIFAAQVAGMKIATYFFHYQLPVASCVIIESFLLCLFVIDIFIFFVERLNDDWHCRCGYQGCGALWPGRYWRDDYYGAGHCHLCHCDGLWQCAVYVICQSYSEYRSRTTCTSGCNDYADAFCHDASAIRLKIMPAVKV